VCSGIPNTKCKCGFLGANSALSSCTSRQTIRLGKFPGGFSLENGLLAWGEPSTSQRPQRDCRGLLFFEYLNGAGDTAEGCHQPMRGSGRLLGSTIEGPLPLLDDETWRPSNAGRYSTRTQLALFTAEYWQNCKLTLRTAVLQCAARHSQITHL